MRVGLIRVMTLASKSAIENHGQVIEEHFPSIEVESVCIADQYKGIYDEESEEQAIPKILSVGKSLAKRCDVLFISCAADPGIDALRKSVRIPVVGAGQSLAAVARVLGEHIGVLTITDELPKPVNEGLAETLCAWRQVPSVWTARDLGNSQTPDHLVDVAKQLEEEGCDLIALACTGFSSIGAARLISHTIEMPVVDPVVAGGSIIAALASIG